MRGLIALLLLASSSDTSTFVCAPDALYEYTYASRDSVLERIQTRYSQVLLQWLILQNTDGVFVVLHTAVYQQDSLPLAQLLICNFFSQCMGYDVQWVDARKKPYLRGKRSHEYHLFLCYRAEYDEAASRLNMWTGNVSILFPDLVNFGIGLSYSHRIRSLTWFDGKLWFARTTVVQGKDRDTIGTISLTTGKFEPVMHDDDFGVSGLNKIYVLFARQTELYMIAQIGSDAHVIKLGTV